MKIEKEYLNSTIKQFEYYKFLGEKAMEQLPEEALFWCYNGECNSVAIIVNHLYGNMRSRWTDLMTTDGEKEWRNRDAEFESELASREVLLEKWNEGWACLLNSIKKLSGNDLTKIIYIRNQGHTVLEAINRQLAHYPYHIGQIIYIAKMAADKKWQSLSIPRGQSAAFNSEKFAFQKSRQHFTDEFLKKK